MSSAYLPSPTSPDPIMSGHGYRSNPTTSPFSTDPHPPLRKSSQESYLPTPQSAMSFNHQQQHSQRYDSSSNSVHSITTPQLNHWSPSSNPGPSNYRRTPNLVSPGSAFDDDETSSRAGPPVNHSIASPAPRAKQKGRMTAVGEQVMVDGMDRMQMDDGDGRIGTEEPFGERSYTELKVLGDGSFGTVWLCDWHSPVRPNTLLSAMQSGAGARPEWAGKRLVALKRMKRVWEGGWSQARNLGEIYSLKRIPQHPAVIPLYDAFISPKSRELYFVFECMEGNLYQLTKSRRGRPLAAGLIASCFHQIVTGLHHIHRHGYFHRDMKPENLLVTTTGLAEYLTAATLNHINSGHHVNGEGFQYEKDVSVIIKLADFGLARATTSKPPYTEYVSTRWYRAPEVLLRSTEYGPPVDMWALGTILAEMLNLKPLFPGVSEIDQVYRICDTLGDPSADYGTDDRGRTIGGGAWVSGIKLAKNVGFSFPKRTPVKFRSLFSEKVPQSLVDCIGDLLRYNPRHRMTSSQCIDHPYFHETLPHLQRTPALPKIAFSSGQPQHRAAPTKAPDLTAPPRVVPPSHSHHETRPAFANGDMRTLPPPIGTPDGAKDIFPINSSTDSYGPSMLVNQLRELDLPTEDLASYGHRPPPSPVASSVYTYGGDRTAGESQRQQAYPSEARRPSHPPAPSGPSRESNAFSGSYAQMNQSQAKVAAFVQQQQQIEVYEDGTPRQPLATHVSMPPPIDSPHSANTPTASPSSKLASLTIGKKKKWGLSAVFGGDKHPSSLPPVDEHGVQPSPSLKRTQSGTRQTDRTQPMAIDSPTPAVIDDPKKAKKEAERAQREAEKAKREAAARMQKERARAVMMKRQQLLAEQQGVKDPQVEHRSGFTVTPELNSKATQQLSASSVSRHHHSSSRDLRHISGMPTSQSATSVRSHESKRSGQYSVGSGHSQSHPSLPIRDNHDLSSRHKARRLTEEDDHSSFDHNSLRSRSVLTVGTIDSDPGPRGHHSVPHLPFNYPKDPLLAKRSMQNIAQSSPRLASISNPSLESQLAHDFQAHATMTSASSPSLAPSASMSPIPPTVGNPRFVETIGRQGSAPTSPYGHPSAKAVAQGIGMGRQHSPHGPVLPSIMSFNEGDQGQRINPMFQVPGQQGQTYEDRPHNESGTTLPPFSTIARVADHSPSSQHRQNQ